MFMNLVKRLVGHPKRAFLGSIIFNLAIALVVIGGFISIAYAQEPGTEGAAQAADVGLKYLGAGLAVAGSTIGAGVALYGATSAGIAALVERSELSVWVLILAGLGEGVAIYGLIIAILILGG